MISAVRLLCWDRPPSRRLDWMAQRGASLIRASFGPLARFWVWVERTEAAPPRFRVRLVVELAMAPAPVKPVARAEGVAGTPEGGLRRVFRALLADLDAQRRATPLPPVAPHSVAAHLPALPPL